METHNGQVPAAEAETMRAARQFRYTTKSGGVYLLLRPNQMSMMASGISDSVYAGFLEQAAAKDGATADGTIVASLMAAILACHVLEPRIFNGHPADCPAGSVTMFHLPDEDPMELLGVLVPALATDRGRAELETVATFRAGDGGAAVPGELPAVPVESGAPAAGA